MDPWCYNRGSLGLCLGLDLEVVWQLLRQRSLSSSCNFFNVMLMDHFVTKITIIAFSIMIINTINSLCARFCVLKLNN